MDEMMTFPDTWEEFEKSYGFTDNEEVYTNGARLIPSFRVKQWLDNLLSVQPELANNSPKLDNKNGELINRRAAIDALKICDNNEDGINCHKCPLRDERWDGPWQDDETNCYTKLMRDSAKLLEMPSEQPERMVLPEICILEGYDTMEDENGNKGFGVYIPSKKQIYVAGDVPQEIMLKALFHELAHWVQDISGRHFDEDEANLLAERAYEALPHDMRGDSDD